MEHASASENTRTLLTMLQWPGFGPAKARWVAQHPEREHADLRALAARRWPQFAGDAGLAEHLMQADALLTECSALGISVLSLMDPKYPSLLREIDDAPAILYVKGSVDALQMPCVAVVGTREASDAGRRAARHIAAYLVRRRMCVVSGLAFGIDAAGHEGALEAGGRTVAVLAHGLDSVSPVSNRPIAERMLKSGGALLSEHPPGTPPHRAEFVRRNRMQSGLSLASIIVESAEEGGAMHQANFTCQQKRRLIVVLPREAGGSQMNVAGAQKLMRERGAIPVRSVNELGRVLDDAGMRSETASSAQPELSW